MRRVLAILVCAVGFSNLQQYNAVAGNDEALETFKLANYGFTTDLLKILSKENGNVLLSPVSISVLLSLLQQGAKGLTEGQISKALRLPPQEARDGFSKLLKHLEKTLSNTTLEWGNKAFLRPDFVVDETFEKIIRDSFKADIDHLNFVDPDAAGRINNWVANVTDGRIHDLVSGGSLNSDTVMVLVNAIFFKGLWSHPFHTKRTKMSQFRVNPSSQVNTSFMQQVEEFVAGIDTQLGAKWVELTFAKDEFAMVFVLPTEDHKLDDLMQRMTDQDLKNILNTKSTKSVRLRLPKFQLSQKLSLVPTLHKMGIVNVFSSDSDLSGISHQKLAVSDVVHQSTIEVNEEGSAASAASAGFVYVLSLDWNRDEIAFNANQPFLLFIVDTTHRIPIFAGRVANPQG